MSDHSPVLYTREQLLHECEVAKLRLAFFDLREEEIAELIASTDNNKMIEDLAVTNRGAAFGFIKRIMRTIRLESFRKSASTVATSLAKFAVVIIAAMTVAVTTAFALEPDFRLIVRDMVIQMTDEYIVIGVKEKQTLSIPDGWNGEYYPSIIPNGFELVLISQTFTESAFVEYENSQGNHFSYFEFHAGSHTNIDIEDAKITTTTVHDIEAHVIEKEGRVSITWTEFDRIFIVMLDDNLSNALLVARSVQRIK